MQILNYNTQKAQRYISLYKKSDINRIDYAYKTRASYEKNAAEQKILKNMREQGGYGYKVISHSHMFFTTAWITAMGNYMVVDTKSNRFHIPLPF